ncbi:MULTISPECIES: helix-turn-helix domain-containing protein [unclassified Streptomyces]|uniref:helix-turn-helix domain-containing protein n=1 Tax=unclassified Streptomyces TaxID=2593676 RepID=UPI000BACBFC2|nr:MULTISPECIES: XRE family transcriptional regulator [unclassified Streptomyces]ASY33782.1 transcriptional regulator [Streptomyces sp. CLI2509]MYX23100.1 helix-turn-helix domain-containing protein [Streptomyces sp. SID8380]
MTGQASEVGARIRELREARALSLSALARRSGLGKATLSGLEAGTRNPTLETLYAVTTALGVPLTAALAPPGAAPGTASGAAVDARLLDRYEDDEAVTETHRVRVRAGAAQHSAAHAPGTREHLTVLAGTVLAGTATAPVRLAPGDAHTWPADVPHLYRATAADAEAILLVRYPA